MIKVKKVWMFSIDKYSIENNISDGISYHQEGKVFISKSSGWNDKLLPDNFIKDITNDFDSNHFINNVNTIYRFPHLSLSRDKLSMYAEKANFKVSRNKDNSDVCVISEKFIEKLAQREWCKSMSKNDATIVRFIRDARIADNSEKMQKFLDWYDNIDEDDLILFNFNYGHIDSKTLSENDINIIAKMIDDVGSGVSSGYVSYYNDYEDYQFLLNNKHKLMLDLDLNKLCVEDSITFDQKDFERLEELLSSRDKENVSIGQTMMANCNVEKCKTFLTLCFAFYSDNMKNTNVWNQVNFKFLRKEFDRYVNISMGNWGHAYDHLVKSMVEDKCLTLYASRYIANKMFIGVLQNNFGVGQKETVFTITADALQLKPEIADKLVDEPDEKLSEYVGTGSHNVSLGDVPNDLPF